MPSQLPRMQPRTRRSTVTIAAAMLAGSVLLAPHALAQDAASVIQLAERDRAALNAVAALGRYEAALQTSPTNYELLWRASREAVDLGEAASDAAKRTEYNAKAEGYARRAVTANTNAADGHFMLAVALGRTALSLGSRERVKYAGEVRTAALNAVRIDPQHAGALHVLGVWNAEIMRLNSFTRFAARNFLGGRVFEQASWAEAVRYMQAAVSADPARITHRLDLAKIYADKGEKPLARQTCEAAMKMPTVEFNDARYKRECEGLLTRWR
jgi:tetratricopeptide (TPR) repeat protein